MKNLFADEIMEGMAGFLISAEDLAVSNAINSLHKAMEILDEIRFNAVADEILGIIVKMAVDMPTKTEVSIPSVKSLMDQGLTKSDFKSFNEGDEVAVAKMNLALRNLGLSDKDIANMIGMNKLMSETKAFKVLDKQNSILNKVKNWISPASPKFEDEEENENPISSDEISIRTMASKKKVKKLTPEKMIQNLKNHGTVFNMTEGSKDRLSSDDKEYANWLKDIRRPKDFTSEHVDPEFAELVGTSSFDELDLSDEDMLDLDVGEAPLQVTEHGETENPEMDFEDEKD